jgi:hypothetical protein
MATDRGYVAAMGEFPLIAVGASVLSFMGAGGYTLIPRSIYDGKCDIKGNISQTTGERIYHVKGQKYYAETRISYQDGERWFCSEADARKAGWRRAER